MTGGLGDMDELYEAIILDHYRSPRNTETIAEPDIDIEVNNPVSYTHLTLPPNREV